MNTKKVIIGVDPGNTGAICFLKGKKVIELCSMPVEKKTTGRGIQVSAIGLKDLLSGWTIKRAYIERINSQPQNTARSMFTFGYGYGVVLTALTFMEVPFCFIAPQEWKKEFVLIGKDKQASITKVLQLYPDLYPDLYRQSDHDKAEAILIALTGKKLKR